MWLFLWGILIVILSDLRCLLHAQNTPEDRKRAIRTCLISNIGLVIILIITYLAKS